MSKIINAIFENGVFKPLEKVNVKEHEKVKIILADDLEYAIPEEVFLDGIINLAKDCSDTDLSVHHDKYLYGEEPV